MPNYTLLIYAVLHFIQKRSQILLLRTITFAHKQCIHLYLNAHGCMQRMDEKVKSNVNIVVTE